MKKIIFIMAVCLAIILQGCAAGNDVAGKGLISEVRQIRDKNKYADLNISKIAKKYMFPGQKREEVDQYLKSNGFTVYYHPATPKKPEDLVAKYYIKDIFNIVGYHEIRIIIDLEDGVVKNVDGILFYHTL
jgi:hypothetical protein